MFLHMMVVQWFPVQVEALPLSDCADPSSSARSWCCPSVLVFRLSDQDSQRTAQFSEVRQSMIRARLF